MSQSQQNVPQGLNKDLLQIRFNTIAAKSNNSFINSNIRDVRKEQTDRTIYIGNLPSIINEDMLIKIFQSYGPINVVKIASDSSKTIISDTSVKYAFIEFADISSVAQAFTLNGTNIGGNLIKIGHSQGPIVVSSNSNVVDLRPKTQTSLGISTIDENKAQSNAKSAFSSLLEKYNIQNPENPQESKETNTPTTSEVPVQPTIQTKNKIKDSHQNSNTSRSRSIRSHSHRNRRSRSERSRSRHRYSSRSRHSRRSRDRSYSRDRRRSRDRHRHRSRSQDRYRRRH